MLTSGSVVNDVFMICVPESRFSTGGTLSAAMATASTPAVRPCARDGVARARAAAARAASPARSSRRQTSSSKQATIGTSVSQLRNARLPLRISTICSSAIRTPATIRARRGPSTSNGATSSTTWLNTTPTACAHGGRK